MNKVAIINSVFEYGSTGTLAKQLYEYGNNNGYEAFVFYGRGQIVADNHVIKIDSKIEFYIHKVLALITGYEGKFSNRATRFLLKRLEEEKIRNVILLNIHGYYLNERKLLTYLKENHIQTVYVTPDEYAGLAKCCYNKGCDKFKTECDKCPLVREYPRSLFFDRSNEIFKMKQKVYSGFDSLTLVGPEANLTKFKESALTKNLSMKRASWGVDLSLYKNEIDQYLYDKYSIPRNKIIILTVAKYSMQRKGVKEYFFEIARRLQDSKYHFINVGYDGNLSADEIPKNMTTVSYLDDQQELAHIYSISDWYLFTSQTETMPISCLISFACETPVVCFFTSGLRYLAARDSAAIRYCDDISIDAMENLVKKLEKKDKDSMRACRTLAEEEYSIGGFNRKVFEVLNGQ